MTKDKAFMTAAYEAGRYLSLMEDALGRLEQSLLRQDELSSLISLCMLQADLGSMQTPQAVTMKLMALGLPVWADPSRCTDELEAERDREFARAEEAYREAEKMSSLCEAMLNKADTSLHV